MEGQLRDKQRTMVLVEWKARDETAKASDQQASKQVAYPPGERGVTGIKSISGHEGKAQHVRWSSGRSALSGD